jgi:putative component of membrane protein insertase Oxa1/YidC/SpoIIIJ protein YidD
MKLLALGAIRFYQRYLSPRKGYCCAYAAVSGQGSCSALGYRAIRRYGVWRGLAVLDTRLEKCGIAYRRHRPLKRGALARQAGVVDCACDLPVGCHVPDVSGCGEAIECMSCDPGGCDKRSCDRMRRRRQKNEEEYVVIPVRGNIRNRGR